MLKRRPFPIRCRITGLVFGVLGALVRAAQFTEWWSYGDWNAVSIGYVLAYFNILPPALISIGSRLLNLPVSAVLLGIGVLVAALGGGIKLRRQTRGS